MTALPGRDLGGIGFLQEALPGVALSALALLTWLGSVPFAVGLLTLAYWFGPRERGALGLAAGLCAVGATVGLKALFAVPRPTEALQLVAATGFGFPSGHAIVATVVWGHLALAFGRGEPRRRLLAAGAVVGVVGLSRVALGVHHTVDVLAGVAVGAGLLLAVRRLDDADRAFGLATGVALFAAVTTGGGGDAMVILGGAAAGLLVRTRVDVPSSPWGRAGAVPAAVAGAVLAALLLAGYRLALPAPIDLAVGAASMAGVLALPALIGRVRAGSRG